MTVKQILYSLQNCSLGQSAARAPTPATPHHPQFPHKMRRRHLESVSSRSLSVRGSWGAAPSVFWYGVPGGTQGPLGKGGAAERWRVTPSVSWVTRHGAQPATTHTSKRNGPGGEPYRLCVRQNQRPAARRPQIRPKNSLLFSFIEKYPSPGGRTN